MTFNQWLRQQQKRGDPVGDFARDTKLDKKKPRSNDIRKWFEHLEKMGACDAAMETLNKAHGEYILASAS